MNGPPGVPSHPTTAPASADVLSEIGRRTAELGIPVGYRPHMGTIGERPDDADRVLSAADPRYVKLLLDVAHYQQGGGDPVAAIRRYRDRLLLLHVKDVESPVPSEPKTALSLRGTGPRACQYQSGLRRARRHRLRRMGHRRAGFGARPHPDAEGVGRDQQAVPREHRGEPELGRHSDSTDRSRAADRRDGAGQRANRAAARGVGADPGYWVGLSYGYVSGTTIADDATATTWQFGYTSQIRATLEKTVQSGFTIGASAGFATAPLTYTDNSFSSACAGSCAANANVAQYMAFVRGGSGVGFHGMYSLEAGCHGVLQVPHAGWQRVPRTGQREVRRQLRTRRRLRVRILEDVRGVHRPAVGPVASPARQRSRNQCECAADHDVPRRIPRRVLRR